MIPRKKLRPNPIEGNSSTSSLPIPDVSHQAPTPSSPSPSALPVRQTSIQSSQGNLETSEETRSVRSASGQVKKTQSWYGSWPRSPKAVASTSLATESVSGNTIRSKRSSNLAQFEPSRENLVNHSKSTTSSDLDLPAAEQRTEEVVAGRAELAAVHEETPPVTTEVQHNSITTTEQASSQLGKTSDGESHHSVADIQNGWFSWLARAPCTETQPTSLTSGISAEPVKESNGALENPTAKLADASQPTPDETLHRPPQITSWFGFWSSTGPTISPPSPRDISKLSGEGVNKEDHTTTDTSVTSPGDQNQDTPPLTLPPPQAGSTWAFWSKEAPKSGAAVSNVESGKIAVIGERSEADPRPMTEGSVPEPGLKVVEARSNVQETSAKSSYSWRKNKRLRPQSMEAEPSSPSAVNPLPTTEPSLISRFPDTEKRTQPSIKADSSSKSITESEVATTSTPNLLLPSFSSTYRMRENPSILKQITRFLLRTSQPADNHLFLSNERPKVRKAIAIGIHGLFPATYLRPMIGQPTGTSLRFASLCSDAIRRWTDENGCPNCEIEKVALEGDGKINERVDNLWKLMLNWIEHIRNADLIILASHSQGVPVSIMLLEKLIDLGIITKARVGVCAMAGVALGPFPDYKSSILMGSAVELWDFGNPDSSNSQRFEAALKRVLNYGARVSFIGSIDDQLVPLESALYSPASHPYIYRAVFIDSRIHAPDFIAHLVGFALKLRNLGISDHGLIRELSVPLAGSLYSGEGHSRLYYDAAVYDLAIAHTLETTTQTSSSVCTMSKREGVGQPNPYVLPWIMRGLLEEEFVKTELSEETEQLLKQFDNWKPTTKALKDVKYRLEAVQSRL